MKSFFALTAFLLTAFLFSMTASAAPAGPAYRLVPVASVAATKSVIVKDILWKCGSTGCVAAQATSRPAVVCAQAARKVGKLVSFTANDQEFDAETLAACNAKAK